MKEKIIAAIREYLESKHKLGERSGGSGHKGFVSYAIDDYELQELENGNTKVIFSYTITTETEFTYYPDNPPYEDKYEEELLLDRHFNIHET
jgi:hypothetical protein